MDYSAPVNPEAHIGSSSSVSHVIFTCLSGRPCAAAHRIEAAGLLGDCTSARLYGANCVACTAQIPVQGVVPVTSFVKK
jgi:hypothetical protein